MGNLRLSQIRKWRLIAWVTLFLFASQPVLLAAGAIVDGSTSTTVREEHGTEVVDIAGPNSGGLSHNRYTDFNVGPNGLILNNSTGSYNSQLTGEMMMGNSNLTGGPARIILNEVTAPNISHLNGMIEVGGDRADVIIANANGIVGNNFGFINANRAVLTTGTPNIQDGNLAGFSVASGNIAIEGDHGLNAGMSRVELLSRTMQINAQIQAGEIKGVSGQYDYSYGDGTATANTPVAMTDENDEPIPGEPAPEVGIDIASLGGMYAQRITLIGTEKGVGVNSGGALTATGGNIDISNDGKITLKDTQATGNITVTAIDSEVVNTGEMSANKIVVSGNTFTNQGINAIVSSRDIQLNATDKIHNDRGTITSTENLNLSSQSIVNKSGTIRSDKNITIIADEVINKRAEFETQEVSTTIVETEIVYNDLPEELGITTEQMIDGSASTPARSGYKTIVDVTETTVTTTEIVKDSGAGRIEAGNNITIQGTTVTNDKSDIIAGNQISITADEVTNIGFEVQQTTTVDQYQVEKNWNSARVSTGYDSSDNPIYVTQFGATSVVVTPQNVSQGTEAIAMAGGRISAPNLVTINANTIKQETIRSQGAIVRDVIRPLDSAFSYELPTSLEYTLEAGEGQDYLIVSSDALTGGTEYLSSTYMLDGLRGEIPVDPETGMPIEVDPYQKRLGDGYHEQELVTSQVQNLTGSALLDGQANIEDQYKALMDNGIEAADELGLRVGRPLTKSQQSRLDKDIVWLEEREVEGERVLVPIVYLAADKQTTSGAIIESGHVVLKADHIENGGIIHGKETAKLEANTLTNDRGRILSGNLAINVSGDIINRNGEIHSDRDLVIRTNGNIVNETVAGDEMKSTGKYSSTNSLSAPAIISSGGNLTLEAAEDITLTGSGVLAEGDVTIKAQNVIGGVSSESDYQKLYTGHYRRYVENFMGGTTDRGNMIVDKNQWSQVETGALIGAGGSVRIESEEDINLKGTTVQANDDILLYSKGDIIVTPGHNSFAIDQTGFDLDHAEKVFKNPRNKYDRALVRYWYQLSDHSGVDVVSPEFYAGGKVQFFSDNDIFMQSTIISSLDGIDVIARKDIDILADKDIRSGSTFTRKENRYWNRYGREYAAPSQLVSDGDINIIAGYTGDFFDGANPRDSVEFKIYDFESDHQGRVRIQGSILQSQQKVNIQAIADVIIEAIMLTMEDFSKSIVKRSNGLSRSRTTRIDHTIVNMSYGSAIFGDSVNIEAGNNVKIEGSEVLAINDLDITAGNDIDIVAAKNTQSDYHMVKVEKSGFSTSGITGISYGKEKMTNTDWSNQEWYTASVVGSLNGDVNINAGGDVNIVGSAVQAVTGDINIEGDDVNIESAVAYSDFHNRFKYKKTGITISVSSSVIDPLNTAYQYANIAKDAKTDELTYAAGAKSAWELNKAYEAMPNFDRLKQAQKNLENATSKMSADAFSDEMTDSYAQGWGESINANQEISEETKKQAKAEIKLNISVGSQSMSSSQDTYVTTNYGSSLTAGGDINITARGDAEAGKDGDINIVGSHISGENVTLIAKDDVNILASQDTQDTTGKNSSSGWSLGMTVGLDSGTVSGGVSINGGKGSNRGDGITNNESIIDARDTLTIISGGDTNIIGSQVYGDTVEMSVGEDLNIVSLQDTDNYRDKQKNWSASASTTGAVSGSFSNQNINSTFESVQEQAGIFAGEGGYNIEVGGNTHLEGAVIASEADSENNRLSTDTLTWSDIENKAEWETGTNGFGFATGPGTAAKDKGLTPNINGKDGEDSSITHSAISPGEIEIRNEEDQKQDVDDLSRDTDNANNPLNPIFDKDEILERQQASALFSEMAFKAIGDLAEKNNWSMNDPRRVILHGLVGGLVAEINNGNFGDGLTAATISELVISQLAAQMAKYKKETGKDLYSKDELMAIATAIGLLVDGREGAAITISGLLNNLIQHGVSWEITRSDIKEKYSNLTDDEIEYIYLTAGFKDGRYSSEDWIGAIDAAYEAYKRVQVSEHDYQAAVSQMSNEELKGQAIVIGATIFIPYLGAVAAESVIGTAILTRIGFYRPLPQTVVNSFTDGAYRRVTTTEVMTVYRVHGGEALATGRYVTTTQMANQSQAINQLALDPSFKNAATHISTIQIPAGTTIYVGTVAPVGSLAGGAPQIFIPNVLEHWVKLTEILAR